MQLLTTFLTNVNIVPTKIFMTTNGGSMTLLVQQIKKVDVRESKDRGLYVQQTLLLITP